MKLLGVFETWGGTMTFPRWPMQLLTLPRSDLGLAPGPRDVSLPLSIGLLATRMDIYEPPCILLQ